MKINRLVIENFKSIERIELLEPNPFTVFVGPNGSGKSNIFEALEFIQLRLRSHEDAVLSLFGGREGIARKQSPNSAFNYSCEFDAPIKILNKAGAMDHTVVHTGGSDMDAFNHTYKEFSNFCHLFVDSKKTVRFPVSDNQRLSLNAQNFEKVLSRVINSKNTREEIFEWLELFIPGFKSVDVAINPFDGKETLLWYEQSLEKPLTKDLISDGTHNILALLTAVYQSDDKPQFLCIEEPENGLHPQVIAEFVNLCRYACEEFGHFIWLNTHSESLVRKLKAEEIVLVDKRDGSTQIKQVRDMNLYDLPMDEAWLSSALGGGTPW